MKKKSIFLIDDLTIDIALLTHFKYTHFKLLSILHYSIPSKMIQVNIFRETDCWENFLNRMQRLEWVGFNSTHPHTYVF